MLTTIKKNLSVPYRWYRELDGVSRLKMAKYAAASRMGFERSAPMTLKPKNAASAATLRMGGSSDLDCFEQIFIDEEYRTLRDLDGVETILDLGANAGFSSAYLLSRFPEARCLAVEPDPRNYEAAKRNLAAFGERAKLVHGAVWSHDCDLDLNVGEYGDGREWATQTTAATNAGAPKVPAWSVASLMKMADFGRIDLLKVDVEGAETEVFNAQSAQWLPFVRNLCIELHGEECERAVSAALAQFQCERETCDELTIFRNLRPRLFGPDIDVAHDDGQAQEYPHGAVWPAFS